MTVDEIAGRATITVREAAELLGIGRDSAYAAVQRGEIPSLRLGRRIVCPTQPLLELVGVSPPRNAKAGLPGPALAIAQTAPAAKQGRSS